MVVQGGSLLLKHLQIFAEESLASGVLFLEYSFCCSLISRYTDITVTVKRLVQYVCRLFSQIDFQQRICGTILPHPLLTGKLRHNGCTGSSTFRSRRKSIPQEFWLFLAGGGFFCYIMPFLLKWLVFISSQITGFSLTHVELVCNSMYILLNLYSVLRLNWIKFNENHIELF